VKKGDCFVSEDNVYIIIKDVSKTNVSTWIGFEGSWFPSDRPHPKGKAIEVTKKSLSLFSKVKGKPKQRILKNFLKWRMDR